MGIKDLNTIIGCFEYIEKTKFKGERVGLDFLNFWYISHSKACKEEINSLPVVLLYQGKIDTEKILQQSMKYFMEYLFGLLRFEIIPVVIFEGKPFDLKNKYALVRRNKDRERSKERLENIKELPTGEKEIQVYKSLLSQSIGFDKKIVTQKCKDMLDRVGLPWLHCVTEAEHLGSALCREGYTCAIYTTDTDVLPIGCPFVISREGTPEDYQSPIFKTVQTHKILKQHDITFDQFQDVCILSSCDYNERIKIKSKKGGKDKSVGIKTALSLIKLYGSFQKLKENEEIIGEENLEYEACKNIFNVFTVKELCPSFTLEQLKLKRPVEKEFFEHEDEKYLSMLVKSIPQKIEVYQYPNFYIPKL